MEPIRSANRASEATAPKRLGLVSEEFWAWATTHAAARTRCSRGGHQPPESLLYSMDSAYPLSINKIGNGVERKEREKEVFIEEALHRTNEYPEEWVWAFEKMKMQRVKRKSFLNNQPARPLRADGDSRTGKSGTRHLLNNTKNKAIPCPREKLVMIAMNAAL